MELIEKLRKLFLTSCCYALQVIFLLLLSCACLVKGLVCKVKQILSQPTNLEEQIVQQLYDLLWQEVGWSKSIRYHKMVFGNDMNCHKLFIKHLGIKLTEVSVDQSDVIIAFVSIISRAGTDIQQALKCIPETLPVVLVVFHHTFDPNYNIPDSSLSVKRTNTLVMDCLFHEDHGMLNCSQNTQALDKTAEYLQNMGPSHRVAV